MERNFYTEGFESFLNDKSDQYKLYPSDKVWKNINRKLHPKRRWPYLAAVLLLLGIGVGGKFYFDENSGNTALSSQNSETIPAGVDNTTGKKSEKSITDQIPDDNGPVNNSVTTPVDRGQLRIAYKNPDLNSGSALNDGRLYFSPVDAEADEFDQNSLPVISTPDISAFNETDETIINSPDLLNLRPIATIGSNSSSFARKSVFVKNKQAEQEELSLSQKLIHKIKIARKKAGWEFHVAPSVSYRRLIGKASDLPFNYSSGTLYNTNSATGTDVSIAVHHKPLMGFETGGSLVYPLTKNLRVRAGIQFNYNRYEIKAYNYKPEMASFGVDYSGANARSINTISYYRNNYSGTPSTHLRNERFMVSAPLGVELTIFGNEIVSFNVASTIQPTYIFDNNSFLISTNMKNYAQEPRLYRNWNVNAGVEALLSVKTGTVNWVVGPQFRYQLLSSYKDNYPISEHLIDYGLKIGVVKPIR